MKSQNWDLLDHWHDLHYEDKVKDRRVVLSDLEPVISNMDSSLFKTSMLGYSFESRPIHRIVTGTGDINVLIWSQMHGNESTGTKALLDILKWLQAPLSLKSLRDEILRHCTLTIIPMLNPDGAERYTRVNGQGIDLNRDVLDKKASESRFLQDELTKTGAEFCFNLHDQRTIFSVGNPPQTATMSFLAPSENVERDLTEGRLKTMEVIAAMVEPLIKLIPQRIGRYTDEFYPTATGDNFQRMGYSTILVESGHYPGDYMRKVSRKMTFLAIISGLYQITHKKKADHQVYFDIPGNEKRYLDVIVKNVLIAGQKADLGVFLKEVLRGEEVCFVPTLEKFEDLRRYSADRITEGGHLNFKSLKDAEKWIAIEFI